MATRKIDFRESKSKKPTYDRTSKMRRFRVFFDEDVGKMRSAFYRKLSKIIRDDSNDILYTVSPGYEHRTDLISAKFYETSKYDWVIEDVNNIKDPIKDVVAGTKLIIPSKAKIYSLT